MLQLFFEGGWEFMSLVTIMALTMFYFSFRCAAAIYGTSGTSIPPNQIYYIRFFGMLALVTGILGQIIGLYEAMKYISAQGGMTREVLAGGLRVSFITTLYGFIIFLIAHLIWFLLNIKIKNPAGLR